MPTVSLNVDLEDRSYPIHIGNGLCSDIALCTDELLVDGRKGVALIDEEVLKSQAEFCKKIISSIPHYKVPSGELSKSIVQLEKIWDFLAAEKIDRSGFLLAIGGGVVGDLAGFAAATYLRGISFYQVPTTLLAMVDSSVGGKTGINLRAGKNLVGSFHQPVQVWSDLDVLSTLSKREFSAGMAEVIKYGMLGDQKLFQELLILEHPVSYHSPNLAELIKRCCAIKSKVVQSDERESAHLSGGRALLNLGHTFGHAIEKVAGYGAYLHGEAVAIGLICALRLSISLGFCREVVVEDLLNLLKSYNLPSSLNAPLAMPELNQAMLSDKKVNRGSLRFVIMDEIGRARCVDQIDDEKIDHVWLSVGAV